ncbi:sialate O-acetylesterase [Sphingomonas sp. R3G8C]|uniref:sialate O-acetylesterase n=1 Tax=Novosphingobium rhizosphaerae TaxID=1551649 RepID=UPI001C544571
MFHPGFSLRLAPFGVSCGALALALAAAPTLAQAAPFALAPILTDNAVFQRGVPTPLRGTGEPGSVVHVRLDDGVAQDATVAADGTWQVALPAHDAGTGHVLHFAASTGQQAHLANVAFGDVFLCSGQSNMEFTLRHATNADTVIGNSANADLRLFNVPKQSSLAPQAQFGAPVAWAKAGPTSVPDFSAVCYFMGADLQATRKVPVGLIAASWGGSIIEDWLPQAAAQRLGTYTDELALLALRRRDPAAAQAAWSERLGGYFARTVRQGAGRPADVSRVWEEWGDPAFAQFDGTATYTATVQLTRQQAGAVQALRLGVADDIDQTLVNGRVVGADVGWNNQRRYALAPGVLRTGANTITVNVLDSGGGGGLHGAAPPALELAGRPALPLKDWTVVQGAPLGGSGRVPMPPWIAASGLTTLYNGMIAPLGDYPLAGIAWYQGESNAGDAQGYRALLRGLIAAWRSQFSTRRFGIVQIAGYGPLATGPVAAFWPQIREAQREVAATDAEAGLAVAIDVGDPDDIHPTRKKPVGHRLALALAGKDVAALPQAGRDGATLRLRFNRPLRVIGDSVPIGFELCDAAAHCRYAAARLDGAETVVLATQAGDASLRYLWADSPVANLFDADASPVAPFTMPLP